MLDCFIINCSIELKLISLLIKKFNSLLTEGNLDNDEYFLKLNSIVFNNKSISKDA